MFEYICSTIRKIRTPESACLNENFEWLEKTVLKVMGLSVFNEKTGFALASPMLVTSYLTGFAALTFGVHSLLTESSGLLNITQSTLIIFNALELMLMWCFLLRKYGLFYDVVHRVIKMTRISNDTPIDKEDGLKFRRLANILQAFIMSSYIMTPFFCNLYAAATWLITKERVLPLHAPIWGIRYDTTNGYIITLIWVYFGMTVAVASFLSHDVSLFMICVGIVGRLEVIKESYISKIGDKSSEYKNEYRQLQLLKKIARDLNDVYDVVIDTDDVFNLSLFTIFFNGTVILCAGYVQLLLMPFGNAICFVVIFSFQLLIHCLCGEVLVQKNEEVSTALYCSQWYNISHAPSRSMFCFMLMRSQRDVGLSIGSFRVVRLELFTDVINTVYGVATFVFNYLLE